MFINGSIHARLESILAARVRAARRSYVRADATCPVCLTTYPHLDRDEDGKTEIPTTKCADLNCPTLLCPCCPTFKCAGCDQLFCAQHAIEEKEPKYDCTCIRLDVDYYDNSDCFACNSSIQPKLLKFCAACLEEIEAKEWPEIPKLEPVLAVVQYPNIPEWNTGGEAA